MIGYIILAPFLLLLGWSLSVWWAFNKWIAIAIPIIIFLILLIDGLQ